MASSHAELVEKLRSIREQMARHPWRERREALRRCLDFEIGQLPRPEIRQALAAVKEAFRDGPSGGSADTSELRGALDSVQAECERLRGERDRLKAELEIARQASSEVEALRVEKERLEQTLSGSGGSLTTFSEGIGKVADGQRPDAEALGLTGEDAALFNSIAELVGFAKNYDVGANNLILEISGKLDAGGTEMVVMARKVFRKRFLESLKGGEAEHKRLRDTLQQSVKFLLLMSLAYVNSYQPGVRRLLGELDPQEFLNKHTGLIGHDFNKAFKEFQRKYGDLASLNRDELWETYFSPEVRQELSDYLDDLPDA